MNAVVRRVWIGIKEIVGSPSVFRLDQWLSKHIVNTFHDRC